jgi:CheY-like chemotaxis protein/HPt (histidine-containing phosphotransfer) domain-containing protein
LRLLVRDTGPGYSAESLETLFEPFGVDEASTDGALATSGVGLSLCRAILERLGGSIDADSLPGAGTSYALYLPIGPHHVAARQPSLNGELAIGVRRRAEPRAGSFVEGTRALIAEDVELNQRLLREMLAQLGIESTIVGDGAAVLEELENGASFDVILMDVQMPRLDGVEAAQSVRRWEKASMRDPMPIVVVTAHALPEERARAVDAGVSAYVTKPVSLAMLERTLARLMPGRSRRSLTPVASMPPLAEEQGVSFDPSLFEELHDAGSADRSFFGTFFGSYQETTAKYVDRLEAAIAREDVVTIMRTAHALKGSAASFGARALSEMASKIESLGKVGEVPTVAALEALRVEAERSYRAACLWLERRFGGGDTG